MNSDASWAYMVNILSGNLKTVAAATEIAKSAVSEVGTVSKGRVYKMKSSEK